MNTNKQQRVVVVTGANKGIGYHIVQGLLKQADKPTVVLTSRDESLGRRAIDSLLDGIPDAKDRIVYHQLDITDDESAKKFVEWLKTTFGKVDVLVNNAAVVGNHRDESKLVDETEFNYVVGTNFFKTRALTDKVTPLLTSDAKIINISSGLGEWKEQGNTAYEVLKNPDFKEKDLGDLASQFLQAAKEDKLKEAGFTKSCYRISKALMNAWTHYVLAKQLKGDQQAFSVCPGWCRTDMGSEMAPRTAEEGADTVIYLVGAPYKRNEELHGKFLRDRKVVDF